jgi:geranylgeranyl diphosphate synthase, type I
VPTASPLDADDVRTRVQKSLDEFLAAQQVRLAAMDDDLVPVVTAVAALLAGGKRLRPAFAYWGWRCAGGADCNEILTAVSALELLQACALIHDDVMDSSDTRRGRPSVHRRFAGRHEENSWLGSATAFGTGAAILLGDLCLAWTDEMLYTSGLPATALIHAKPVLDDMRTELMAGQYLDLLEQARGGGSVARSLQVARYKAAKYTIERPLHLGAMLAGGDARLLDTFTAYGLPLGEAFQLRDDVLGVFGDPDETGKPAGDDLREGKRTVLVAMTMEAATPEQAALLEQRLGDPDLDAAGVAELRDVIVATGALDRVEQLIGQLTEQALTALSALAPQQSPASSVLRDLATAATARRT